MSEKTWLKEFYPVPANRSPKSALGATRHSLRKWRGLTKAALNRHGLTEPPISIDAWSCALCDQFLASECAKCPLYATLGGRCDTINQPFRDYHYSRDARPMITALRKTLKRLTVAKK